MTFILANQCENHDPSLAKKAVTFFKISSSINKRLFSACKRCSSSSIGERLPLPGNALEPSASSSCFQRKIRFELMPRRRPAHRLKFLAALTSSRLRLCIPECNFVLAWTSSTSMAEFTALYGVHHSWGGSLLLILAAGVVEVVDVGLNVVGVRVHVRQEELGDRRLLNR